MTSSRPRVAIIAGTGVSEHFELSRGEVLRTGFGRATAFRSKDGRFYVLPRHGAGQGVPPHKVNYRANIAGLRRAGVESIVAASAVGSMKPSFRVGETGLVEQFLDFTKGRKGTFFEKNARFTDMTTPYSRGLNGKIASAARSLGVELHRGLVYVCTDGPRYETAAEIKMFRLLGGDVVGMTGVPEVVLAKELGMDYSSVVVATNWAAGMQERVGHEEVVRVMRLGGERVARLAEETVNLLVGGGGWRGERSRR